MINRLCHDCGLSPLLAESHNGLDKLLDKGREEDSEDIVHPGQQKWWQCGTNSGAESGGDQCSEVIPDHC